MVTKTKISQNYYDFMSNKKKIKDFSEKEIAQMYRFHRKEMENYTKKILAMKRFIMLLK